MENKSLNLYVLKGCPYCIKVLNYLEEEGIEVDLKYIEDKENEDRLIEVGGKRQVPCLFIDEEPMYESDDIIEWFRENR